MSAETERGMQKRKIKAMNKRTKNLFIKKRFFVLVLSSTLGSYSLICSQIYAAVKSTIAG